MVDPQPIPEVTNLDDEPKPEPDMSGFQATDWSRTGLGLKLFLTNGSQIIVDRFETVITNGNFHATVHQHNGATQPILISHQEIDRVELTMIR